MMKVRDLIIQLQAMPPDADVQLHLEEEYHGFVVVHATAGGAPPHLVALEPQQGPPHIAEINARHLGGNDFDGAKEPMRALRDLINVCEGIFGDDNDEQAILRRAQDGFTTVRKLFGDSRPAEMIAFAAMLEPDISVLQAADGSLEPKSRN